MNAETLTRELRQQRLTVMAVTAHRTAPDILVVYLHPNASDLADRVALNTVAVVPGVIAVVESVHTPAVLLVRVQVWNDGTAGDGEVMGV